MNIYQRTLEFYLDTRSYFDLQLDIFFEAFNHCGICQRENKEYVFESEIYRIYNKRIVDPNYTKEFHRFRLKLTDTEIKCYFTKNYENGQLAAIIFAHWFGLTKRQIQQVASLKNKQRYPTMLNYFLWNPAVQEYTENSTSAAKQKYYVLDKDTREKIAVCYRENHDLVSDNADIKFNLDIKYSP